MSAEAQPRCLQKPKRTSTDVEEVGGAAAVEVEDVHGGHGESGAVDEASDRAVKLDEVEAKLGRLDLGGVLLGQVAEAEDGLRVGTQKALAPALFRPKTPSPRTS